MANDTQAERIAILFAIPITREEFYEKAADSQWDYGRKLLARRSIDEAFEQTYKPVTVVAKELIDRASRTNVSIYRRATLGDMVDATSEHDVVVIVAHWRGSVVEDTDLLSGWSTAMISNGPEAIAHVRERIQRFLRSADIRLAGSVNDRVARMKVVSVLNRLVVSGELREFLPHHIGTQIITHDLILDTLSRDLIDDAFDGALQRGNQLELFDGLHAPADVDRAIDSDFYGLIDLSCCTSSILGTYLKLIRGDRLRVLIGDQLIVPAPQLRLLERTLELLGRPPRGPYADARLALIQGLANHFRKQETARP